MYYFAIILFNEFFHFRPQPDYVIMCFTGIDENYFKNIMSY
jgi:hypothetical protein